MLNTDFSTLATELKGAGISLRVIADRVGCSEFTINRIKNGDQPDPKFSVGAGIIQLHKYHVTDAPVVKKAAEK